MIWMDGRWQDTLPAELHALHYGDGVFRTLLRCDGRNVCEAEQLEHLVQDARALHIDAPAPALRTLLRDAEAGGLPALGALRLSVLRGGEGRGYTPDAQAPPRLMLSCAPLPEWPARNWRDGVICGLVEHRLALQPAATAGAKHMNRLDQVLASREAAVQGLDEGLCCDLHGHLVSGCRSNLFWLRDGRLFTPALEQSGVRGLTRGRVLRAAREAGLTVEAVTTRADALDTADEIFICNSLIGIWPVRRYGTRRLPPAHRAQELLATLRHPLAPAATR